MDVGHKSSTIPVPINSSLVAVIADYKGVIGLAVSARLIVLVRTI